MSYFTTQLKDVMNVMTGEKYNPERVSDMSSLIIESIPEIFTYFPLWDENYREVLCSKILAHFYFHEIGYETVPLFLFQFNRKLNEIMPYYNDLYKTQVHDLNEILDIDMRERYGERKKSNENASETRKDSGNKGSNTDTSEARQNDLNAENTQKTDTTDVKNINENQKENLGIERESGETKTTTDTINTKDATTFGKKVTHEYDSDNTNKYGSEQTTDYGSQDKTTYNNSLNQTGTISTSGSTDDTDKFSDTPQGGLNGIASDTYLTNATMKHGTSNSTDTYNRTDTKTGNDIVARSGKDTISHTGSDTLSHTGSDTDTDSGTETVSHTGTDKVDEESGRTENETHTKGTDKTSDETSSGTQDVSGTQKSTEKSTAATTQEYIEKWLEDHGVNSEILKKEGLGSKRHTYGRNGNFMDTIMKWRESIINIDMMIIKDLSIMFMGIYD